MTPQELERERKSEEQEFIKFSIDYGCSHGSTTMFEKSILRDGFKSGWLASAERFGWKRFDTKDESTFPERPTKTFLVLEKGEVLIDARTDSWWASKNTWLNHDDRLVIAYYELPPFQQE